MLRATQRLTPSVSATALHCTAQPPPTSQQPTRRTRPLDCCSASPPFRSEAVGDRQNVPTQAHTSTHQASAAESAISFRTVPLITETAAAPERLRPQFQPDSTPLRTEAPGRRRRPATFALNNEKPTGVRSPLLHCVPRSEITDQRQRTQTTHPQELLRFVRADGRHASARAPASMS